MERYQEWDLQGRIMTSSSGEQLGQGKEKNGNHSPHVCDRGNQSNPKSCDSGATDWLIRIQDI